MATYIGGQLVRADPHKEFQGEDCCFALCEGKRLWVENVPELAITILTKKGAVVRRRGSGEPEEANNRPIILGRHEFSALRR